MRKIIIQERINEPSDFSFRYVFWASVPTERQSFYADQNKTSVIKDISAQELQDIKDGKVLEKQESAEYVAGTSIASIQTDLIKRYNTYQAQITAINPWKYYGTSWDGSAWNVKTTV